MSIDDYVINLETKQTSMDQCRKNSLCRYEHMRAYCTTKDPCLYKSDEEDDIGSRCMYHDYQIR